MADQHAYVGTHAEQISLRFLLGGSLGEGLGGAAAVVVSIAGFATLGAPTPLLSIAVILVGAALFFEGGAVASRFSTLLSETSNGRLQMAEFGSGMTAEILGGMTVAALGILALLNVSPVELTAIAAMVAGGSVFLGSMLTARLHHLGISRSGDSEEAQDLAHSAVSSAANIQVLIGFGAAVLGLLSLLNIAPHILSLAAMLSLGVAVLVSGGALSGLAMMLRR
jgi:hypothetical protein